MSLENARRKGIMPTINPTGNPFDKEIRLPDDMEQLKKLQIRVQLFKMGQAPRVFSEKLKDANNPESMSIDSAAQGRVAICERFLKIERA